MHTTAHDEKYDHSICSTICARECTECINSCLAARSEGASTARRAVCCDNLLPAWTQAANEASPPSNADAPFHHSAGEPDLSANNPRRQTPLHAAAGWTLSSASRAEREAPPVPPKLAGSNSCSPLNSRQKPAPHNGPLAF